VINPFSGLTPEAIPKAMASGRATMPTRHEIRHEPLFGIISQRRKEFGLKIKFVLHFSSCLFDLRMQS